MNKKLVVTALSFFFFSLSAAAGHGVICGESGCTIGDYNLGAVAGGELIQIGANANPASGIAGVMANGELSFLGHIQTQGAPITSYTFFDARLITLITSGFGQSDDGSVRAYFNLRFMGELSGGLMVYKVIPLNMGVEDFDFRIQGGQTSQSSLVGTSIVIPVSLIAGMDQSESSPSNLALSVTVGMRTGSQLSEELMGFQPKVRFISDKVSIEAKYLYAYGPTESEQKGSLIAAVNHLFRAGDQVGLIGISDRVNQVSGSQTISELFLFYGGNL